MERHRRRAAERQSRLANRKLAVPRNASGFTDFTARTDKIDLSALDRTSGYTGSDPIADG